MGLLSKLFTKETKPLPPVRVESESVPGTHETEARDEVEYADRQDYDPLPVLTLRRWDYGHGLDEDASGYGFTAPDGKVWPAHNCLWSTWQELGVLVINVVGVSHHLDDLADPSFDPGRPIRLLPEPENPHDPNAIAIRNWKAESTAGYVKKGSTQRLRNLLRGQDLRVMALYCRYDQAPPHGRRVSLKVAIFRADRLIGAEDVPPHPRIV
jgi:hypothetical protein